MRPAAVIPTEPAHPLEPSQPAALAGQPTLDKLTEAATVRLVYGEPVAHGDTVVIPAAEVLTALGFGSGGGGLRYWGGGGGGWTIARPVGVIVLTPRGVRVKPIFDFNKLIATALPILGVLLTLLLRARRAPR